MEPQQNLEFMKLNLFIYGMLIIENIREKKKTAL